MNKSSRTTKKESAKPDHVPTIFARIHSALICGRHGSYNMVSDPEPKLRFFRSKPDIKPRHQTFLQPKDAKFNEMLCSEGLLKDNIIIKETGVRRKNKTPVFLILTKYEHPVLNICLGFSDLELCPNRKISKFVPGRTLPVYSESYNTEYDNMRRVSAGIYRVLFGNDSENGSMFDGFPTSLWYDVYDPAVEQFLLMKFRRRRQRSIFTQRRRHSRVIRPPSNSPNTIGDVVTYHQLIGPNFFERQREIRHQRVLIAVMTHRIGEPGERQRATRLNIEPEVPLRDDYERELNEAIRRRRNIPLIQRSGSSIDQFEPQPRPDSRASDIGDHGSRHNHPVARRIFH